jgi:iron complex outermembrane receptor protein
MKYTFILLLLVTFSPLSAQIRGRIIDASTGEPVTDALIISGKARSYSGPDGTFSSGTDETVSVFAEGYQIFRFSPDTIIPDRSALVIPLLPMSHNLSGVSVTAYNSPEKLISVAGAVSVVIVDSLQNGGYNITPSLTSSPGLIIQEATPGTMKLTLRGIGSRYPYGTKKIKMFFDEIPLYSAEGETYFDDIDPGYVSRIEILRGPASSVFGASLGGTVILYPVRPGYGRTEFSLMSSAGSYGYLKNTAAISGNEGKNSYIMSFSDIRSDGYRANSKYSRNSLMVSFSHRYGERLTGGLHNWLIIRLFQAKRGKQAIQFSG